jgi:acyl-CoA reductase-like NAD-dependent aldehyde dehydrogenase
MDGWHKNPIGGEQVAGQSSRLFAGEALRIDDEKRGSGATRGRGSDRPEPLGMIDIIMLWNFPFAIPP